MQTVNVRSLVFIALFAALFIVLSIQHLRITFTPVPITFQTLGVILAGVFLRPKQAVASILLVYGLVAIGLPLLGGKGGLPTFVGYTGGFIFAFPFCALFISLAMKRILRSERLTNHKWLTAIVLFIVFELFSSFLAYVPGVPWLMHVLNWSWSQGIKEGVLPFLLGDAIKSAVGVLITLSLLGYIKQLRASTKNAPSSQASAIRL
ncbi:biotin transporter BioY [Paenibacillus soyae]|uniref:Biotin transporter n=1 Tax=Paenibacillus soyae TaxID=2969249 RepID=A0A9X2MSP5_9BACL|nr:biotin transporter BioY [Paenibacillus soyae]MCR2805096.1 biotin transporter BioY [Paenibacillus soyae]